MRAKTVSIVHEDAREAGRDAVDELLDELGETPQLVLAFVTSSLDPQRALEGVWSGLDSSVRLLGCSSFAEIGASEALSDSVTLMGIVFETVEWELFKLDAVGDSSRAAGRELARDIAAFEPKLVMVLPDGVVANTMKFVNGMQDQLGADCPIIGGLASEHLSFEHTHQFLDREVFSGGAVALALRGPLRVATAAGSGFQPVGGARTATRVVDDKYIYALDGESAVELYKSFLGPDAAQRPTLGLEFPLAIVHASGGDYMESDERSLVIRAIRTLDEERGAIECGGDVYEGARLRMTRASKEDLVAAAVNAVERAKRELPNAQMCLLFNCVGRKIVLGARYQSEVEAALAKLGDIPRIGFYTYGEIAPIGGTNMYHDETFTLALLGPE